MTIVYLAWRDPGRRWYPVGRLHHADSRYHFSYLEGAKQAAEEAGFEPLLSFPDFQQTYESASLFPLFANRIPSPTREEFSGFVQWLNLDPSERDSLVLLARSAGRRETDTFEVFACPTNSGGTYRAHVFIHGIRHRTPEAIEMAGRLAPGDILKVEHETTNQQDQLAIKAMTSDGVHHLGYLPRYIAADVHALRLDTVRVTVERVNPPPAPLQFRVLVNLVAHWPEGFHSCSGHEFTPINAAATCPP